MSNTIESTFLGVKIPSDLAKKNFLSLYGAAFFGTVLTVFPAIIQPLFLKEIIGIPDKQAGSVNSLLQNMSQIASLLLAGYVGYLSDRVGRRILLLWGFISTGIFYLTFAYSKEIGLLIGMSPEAACLIIRFLLGVALLFTWPQFTTLTTDYTYKESRGRAMAIYGFMVGLATIFTAGVMGQLPKKIGIYGSFYVIALITLIGWFVAQIGIVDRFPENKKKEGKLKEALALAKESTSLKVSYVATFVSRADAPIFRLIFFVWAVTESRKYGFSPAQATGIGGLVLMGLATTALLSNIALGPMVDKIGRVSTLMTSMTCATAGFLILYFFKNPFTYWIAIPVALVGFGMSGAVIGANTLAADSAPKHMVGTVIGGLTTIQSIGIIVLLQSSGFIRDIISNQGAFLFKAAVNILAILWIFSVRKKCK
ncbi:MAG: hypothetical protein A2149_08400 [Candidatus Schekmanbacteria bacterium RBG_16_38_11]|uniref:Major facilitator superfamily (MFS) profile domain-containing protein n=1 Tax=Candidatus Schekmanbacteria bacterium RBG_16_38_11 TaxID=1817880 RepID=A0A1F7RTC4_9BACT|nr:MAG: hypothetical protein A2149_08400 [Candidatus Schekmanbacteria bacterium RBG_16_38_11]